MVHFKSCSLFVHPTTEDELTKQIWGKVSCEYIDEMATLTDFLHDRVKAMSMSILGLHLGPE